MNLNMRILAEGHEMSEVEVPLPQVQVQQAKPDRFKRDADRLSKPLTGVRALHLKRGL
jgi:hypothetical protein